MHSQSMFYLNALFPRLTVLLVRVRPLSLTSRSRRARGRLVLLSPELSALVWRPSVQRVVELQPPPHGLRHLLRGDPDIVKLLQLRDILQNCPAIQIGIALGTGILLQPEVLQPREVPEVTDLADVGDTILTYVELLQGHTVLNVGQC